MFPKFLVPQSINFSNQKPNFNNNLLNSNNTNINNINESCETNLNEIENRDFLIQEMNAGDNNEYIIEVIREKDDLKRLNTELKMGYLELSREKENKIKSLSMNLSLKTENCDKMIQETEENYSNLKIQYDRVKEESLKKDLNISNLIQKVRNLESDLSLQITKSNLNPNEAIQELQIHLNEANDTLEKTSVSLSQEIEKNSQNIIMMDNIREENNNLKLSFENLNNEFMGLNTQKEFYFKNNEIFLNESFKMKNDIFSYKNEILLNKDKITQLKNEIILLKSDITKLKNQNDILKLNKSEVKSVKLINESSNCSFCTIKENNIFQLEDTIRFLEQTAVEKTVIIQNLEVFFFLLRQIQIALKNMRN